MGRPGATSDGLSTLKITGGTIRATETGVSFNSRALGGFKFDMTGGTIGTNSERVGKTGLAAGIQGTTSTNSIDIDSDSTIYATERGMSLSHRGTGTIDVDLTSNSIIDTTGAGNRGAGVFITRNGSGNIELNNAGTIRSAGHDGIFVLNEADGQTRIDHKSGGIIEAGNYGIYVRQGNAGSGGNGTVSVTSAGDISTTGSTGIFLDLNRGDATANDQVSISLAGGTINARDTGVSVNSRTMGGLAFSMANGASIGTTESRIGQTGASLSLTNSTNRGNLDLDSNGAIHAIWRGLSLSHAGNGNVDIDLGANSEINTQQSIITVGDRTLTRGAGVFATHSGAGAIQLDHAGRINSGIGTGIYASHSGSGSIDITNTGRITAGFQGIQGRIFSAGTGSISIVNTGTITASRGPGIYARHDGESSKEYGIDIDIRGDVSTSAYRQASARADTFTPTGNSGIRITHNTGTLTGFHGIFAGLIRFSGSTYTGPKPSSEPPYFTPAPYGENTSPKVHIVSRGRIVARSLPNDRAGMPGFPEAETRHQVGYESWRLAGITSRPSGIVVGGTDYQQVGQFIAAGDKDLTAISETLRNQFRDVAQAAMEYSNNPQAISLGNLLDPRSLVGDLSGVDLDDDDAVDVHLRNNNNELLMKFLEFTLTEAERDVLEAIYGIGDLETALSALPSSYDDDYKNGVRWYAGAYNDADFRVEIERGGTIVSEGDGIRAIRRYTSDSNGGSEVIIREGAIIEADRYGVRMRGAGLDGDIRDQNVTIEGQVISYGTDGAGIALRGGGRVTFGPKGTIITNSGTSILVDEPGELRVVITLDTDEDYIEAIQRTLPGVIVNDADMTEVKLVSDTGEKVLPKLSDAEGGAGVVAGAFDLGLLQVGNGSRLSSKYAPRARVYETLPSLLLEMTDFTRYVSAPNAPQGQRKRLARVTANSGTKAPSDSSTDVSFDHKSTSIDIGREFILMGEGTHIYLHYQKGSTDVEHGGKINVNGTGIGFARTLDTDRFFIDLNALFALYKLDLSSSVRGALKSGVSGKGFSAGMQVGRSMKLFNMDMKPGLGLKYVSTDVDNFTDNLGVEVASTEGRQTIIHLGTDFEKKVKRGKIFGNVGLEKPVKSSASTTVGRTVLSSTPEDVAYHLEGGMVFDSFKSGISPSFSVKYMKEKASDSLQAALAISF